MTKKEMYNHIATVNANDAEIVAFCEHEIDLLNARKSGSKGQTKVQKENEVIMTDLSAFLSESGESYTVTELIQSCDVVAGLTNQKVSALLRKMVEAGSVVKTIEKKKAYFRAA